AVGNGNILYGYIEIFGNGPCDGVGQLHLATHLDKCTCPPRVRILCLPLSSVAEIPMISPNLETSFFRKAIAHGKRIKKSPLKLRSEIDIRTAPCRTGPKFVQIERSTKMPPNLRATHRRFTRGTAKDRSKIGPVFEVPTRRRGDTRIS